MTTFTTTTAPVNTSATGLDAGKARTIARATGVLYLAIFVCGLFAELYVRGTLVDPASSAATAQNIATSQGLFRIGFLAELVMVISDVAVAVLLYVLLRPLSRPLAGLAGAFRLTQAAVLGTVLLAQLGALAVLDSGGPGADLRPDDRDALVGLTMEMHSYGYLVALVFFAVHLLLLAYLLVRAPWFPTWLGILLGVAGIGYLADSLSFFLISGYDGTASAILLAPAVVAEFSMILWLLVKGVDVPAWRRSVEGDAQKGDAA